MSFVYITKQRKYR